MSNTTRIARNTLALYFRQILIMLVSLYTVRVVLATLGAEDYGIYNVVAGVVTMFGFLSNSMAAATQRYLSFELGRGDVERLRRVFCLSLTIYALIAAVIVLLAETVGLWVVHTRLVIPPERKSAALWVYQCAVVSFLFTMFTAPYMAAIIAHENMNVYAYVSILEAALRLGIVVVLSHAGWDKLKLYGTLMCAVTGITTAAYRTICVVKYQAYRFRLYWDKGMFKEITGYTGWNLFGSVAGVVKNQGINVLLNIYFGPVVNAARAVALQVDTAVLSFAQNFTTAVRPRIVKSYAAGNRGEMLALVFRASRGTFFLLFVFFLPLQLELPAVLTLWLKSVPERALVFTRIALVSALVDAISYPLMGASQATGKIRLYQAVVGGIAILNLPVCLAALTAGGSAVSVMIIGAVLAAAAYIARVVILSRQFGFSLGVYARSVVLPAARAALCGAVAPTAFAWWYPPGLVRLFLTVCISVVSVGASVFFAGLSGEERRRVKAFVAGRRRARGKAERRLDSLRGVDYPHW